MAKFKGHSTFAIRQGWLAKVIEEIQNPENDGESLFSTPYGIERLGIGANMVTSLRYWVKTIGLVGFNPIRKYYLTEDVGEVIAVRDPFVEQLLTLWILHINLIRNEDQATTWSVFFNEFDATEFSKDDFVLFMKSWTKRNGLDVKQSSVDSDINVLLSMYNSNGSYDDPEDNIQSPFARLNLLSEKHSSLGHKKFLRNRAKVDADTICASKYAINLMFAEGENSLDIEKIETGKNSLKALFGFDRMQVNEVLDKLTEEGYIKVIRTGGLDRVELIKSLTQMEILDSCYNQLQ